MASPFATRIGAYHTKILNLKSRLNQIFYFSFIYCTFFTGIEPEISKNRKHNEDYVLYGSTCINEREGTQTAKLKEHLTSVHLENASKDEIFS
jgi:hypothetical protein